MELIKTTAWKSKKFMGLVIKQIISKEPLDPWPAVKNTPLFILCDKKKQVSYCTIKSWKNGSELGTCVTEEKFRGKGYSSKLITEVLKNYEHMYVTCETKLEGFYNKFGFKKIKEGPYPIKQRLGIVNLYNKIFGGKKYITLER